MGWNTDKILRDAAKVRQAAAKAKARPYEGYYGPGPPPVTPQRAQRNLGITQQEIAASPSSSVASSTAPGVRAVRRAKIRQVIRARERALDRTLKKLVRDDSDTLRVLDRREKALWKSAAAREREAAVGRVIKTGLYERQEEKTKAAELERKMPGGQGVVDAILARDKQGRKTTQAGQVVKRAKRLWKLSELPGQQPEIVQHAPNIESAHGSGKAGAYVSDGKVHLPPRASRQLGKKGGASPDIKTTLLHEYAHTRQHEGLADGFDEGLADLFSKRKAKELGIPATARTPTYKSYRKQARRGTTRRFQMHGQFAKEAEDRKFNETSSEPKIRKQAPKDDSGKRVRVLGKPEKKQKRIIRQAAKTSGSRFLTKQAVKQGRKEGVAPSLLMGVMDIESDFGRLSNTFSGSSAGAQGVTQFMPGTAPSYGVDVSNTKPAIKTQVRGAARYLKELGVNEDPARALAGYVAGPAADPSVAGSYPADVLASAAKYAKLDKVKGKPVGPPPKQSVSRFNAIVDEAKKIESAAVPYVYGGGHVAGKVPGPTKTTYDCSSSVSRVLQSAGVKLPGALVSGDLATTSLLKDGPGAVTVYANDGHTFMKIGNRFWGTSASNPGGGPGWVEGGYDAEYLSQYTVRHVPGLDSKVAKQMGIRLSNVTTPGLTYSSGGSSATVTSGVVRDTPGPSDKPIKLDPKLTKKRKAKRIENSQRQALIREIIAEGPVAAPVIDEIAAPAVREKVSLGL